MKSWEEGPTPTSVFAHVHAPGQQDKRRGVLLEANSVGQWSRTITQTVWDINL